MKKRPRSKAAARKPARARAQPKQQPSGAAKRRARREAEEAEDDARSVRSSSHDLAQLKRYRAIGPPPVDVVGRVAWAQQMMAQALWDSAADPATKPRDKRRVIGDLGAKVGLVAVRALYEERLKALEAKVYGGEKGTTDAEGELEVEEP